MSAESTWPTDTDLFFLPGSNKLHLNSQKPLVHLVVGDVIENVRAMLLTQNAFPEGTKAASSLVEDCLLAVAEQHKPAALSIHERLHSNQNYMKQLVYLPQRWIPLFRGDVKDNCTIHAMTAFLAIAFVEEITSMVTRQLQDYTYIFPGTNLYVALLEWSTGHYQLVEFAANRFLDVYKGHVQSLENIQRRHPSAFHQMMADIYSQSIQLVTTQTMGVPPVELDMDNLEE
ncbi:hypothetical protein BC827DRAFT_1274248 [Russula dissimulans]|nr:hypothetical protein BC827DRAFT_1274248 [Russula dissimulans]